MTKHSPASIASIMTRSHWWCHWLLSSFSSMMSLQSGWLRYEARPDRASVVGGQSNRRRLSSVLAGVRPSVCPSVTADRPGSPNVAFILGITTTTSVRSVCIQRTDGDDQAWRARAAHGTATHIPQGSQRRALAFSAKKVAVCHLAAGGHASPPPPPLPPRSVTTENIQCK